MEKELVKNELKNRGSDESILLLCDEVFKWYEEGGPSLIEENIKKKVREITRPVKKEIEEIKKVTPIAKKKKRKRG